MDTAPRPHPDVAARLRDAITRGQLMPNERLIEADLTKAYGVNRANIRMALAMLDQEGLVVREPNRGARVRAITDAEAIEIADTRLAIEVMVARQAAARAMDTDRTALHGRFGEMRDAGLMLRALVPHLAGIILIVEIGNRDRERRGQGAAARLKRQRGGGEQERDRGFRAIHSFHARSSLRPRPFDIETFRL